MPSKTPALFNLESDGDVIIVRILSREFRHPIQAEELGEQLYPLVERDGYRRLLLDFAQTDYLGSTAFAVIMKLAQKALAAGGRVDVCGLQPAVRTGANILGLGRVVGIYDDERAALGGG
jgi:anti-sigma B factor antagonist